MARRADHTRQELTELIVRAGIEIIEKEGFSKFSARQVASKIGYTVGTIYNVFGSHDELILHLNARTLDLWFAELENVIRGKKGKAALKQLAKSYLDFSARHYNVWSVLFTHQLDANADIPEWYRPKLTRFFTLVEDILLPMVDNKPKIARQSSRVLWAGIHGICMLSLTGKLDMTESDSGEDLAMNFIDHYLKGLVH